MCNETICLLVFSVDMISIKFSINKSIMIVLGQLVYIFLLVNSAVSGEADQSALIKNNPQALS